MGIDRAQIRWNGWGWAAHQEQLAERQWLWLARELGMPALLATPGRPLEEARLPAPRLAAETVARLARIVGPDRVKQDDRQRAFHAVGRSYDDLLRLRAGDLAAAPDAAVYPRSEEEVLAILALAAEKKIAVFPFGGGTGRTDGVSAVAEGLPGAVSLDMSGMARLVELNAMSGTATFEAGVTGPALEKALSARRLTLGHLPESFEFSTLGGWIAAPGACQEEGPSGGAADWLRGARLATSRGLLEIAPAAAAPLRHMILGSAGRLGVITQATVRARPVLPVRYAGFLFADFAAGLTALREAARAGIAHVLFRLSDAEATRFRRALAGERGLREWLTDAWQARRADSRPAGMIAGFTDSHAMRAFSAIAKKLDVVALGAAPGRLWAARRFHAPYLRDVLLDRGVGMETLETAASWSDLPTLYAATRAALYRAMRTHAPRPGARGLVLAHTGPVHGDNAGLSFTAIFARQLDDEIAQGRAIRHAGLAAIQAHGGVPAQQGVLDAAALCALKAALDPAGILNPGRPVPPN